MIETLQETKVSLLAWSSAYKSSPLLVAPSSLFNLPQMKFHTTLLLATASGSRSNKDAATKDAKVIVVDAPLESLRGQHREMGHCDKCVEYIASSMGIMGVLDCFPEFSAWMGEITAFAVIAASDDTGTKEPQLHSKSQWWLQGQLVRVLKSNSRGASADKSHVTLLRSAEGRIHSTSYITQTSTDDDKLLRD